MHYVYILFSPSLDKYYTGETSNLETRLIQHKTGFYATAYLRLTSDWELFLKIDCGSNSEAKNIEKHIKKISSTYIRNMKKYPEIVLKLKARYLGT